MSFLKNDQEERKRKEPRGTGRKETDVAGQDGGGGRGEHLFKIRRVTHVSYNEGMERQGFLFRRFLLLGVVFDLAIYWMFFDVFLGLVWKWLVLVLRWVVFEKGFLFLFCCLFFDC